MCSRSSVAKPASDGAALLALALALTLSWAGPALSGAAPSDPPVPAPRGAPAPMETVQELQATLARARERFEARDTAGVLSYVSDQYRSGPLTKAGIRGQLLGIFGLYEAVRARVTIDAVDMVDGGARVYTTGEISGQLPIVRSWVTFLWWEREPEIARREGSVWRLYGFHERPARGTVSPATQRAALHGFAVYLASLTATWTGSGSGPASDSICQAPIWASPRVNSPYFARGTTSIIVAARSLPLLVAPSLAISVLTCRSASLRSSTES